MYFLLSVQGWIAEILPVFFTSDTPTVNMTNSQNFLIYRQIKNKTKVVQLSSGHQPSGPGELSHTSIN